VSSYHNLQKKIIHPFNDTSLLLFSANGIFYTGARTSSTVAEKKTEKLKKIKNK
jgi:CHASE3 domain sensor protein